MNRNIRLLLTVLEASFYQLVARIRSDILCSVVHGQIPVLALASKTSAHQFEQKSREGQFNIVSSLL